MADRPFRVLPRVTASNEHFWRGGAQGRLQFLRCKACGTWIHPPQPLCPSCYRKELEVAAVSGLATVATFTLNHQPWVPAPDHPYAIAIVELDEQPGLRLMTNIVNCPAEAVRIGMRVRAIFEQREDVWIPLFEPVGESKRPQAARSESQASGVEKGASGERANHEPGGKDSLASPEL